MHLDEKSLLIDMKASFVEDFGEETAGENCTEGDFPASEENPCTLSFEDGHHSRKHSGVSFASKLHEYDTGSEDSDREDPFSRISTCSSISGGESGDMIKIALSRNRSKRVTLNVGGEKNEILWEKLERYSETRLGKLAKCTTRKDILEICDDFSLSDNEYFFDRIPKSFVCILNFYRMGKLHLPQDVCIVDFIHEMTYWEIDEIYLDTCCHMKYQQRKDHLHHEAHLKKSFDFGKDSFQGDVDYEIEDFGEGCTAKYRKFIWDLFERSDYWPAKIMTAVSIVFILFSIVTFTISTVPDFQDVSCKHLNKTLCSEQLEALDTGVETPVLHKEIIVTKSYIIVQMEQLCIAWFTIEFLLRFISCPYKKKFLKSWLNIVDLIAILPYYISAILIQLDTPVKDVQVLMVFRVLRIFKIARHSTGLKSLGYTFRKCHQDLGVLLLFLGVGVLIFSSFAYFAEREMNKQFSSIPSVFWFALITMTTVGYGDMTPITPLGKVIACVTAISGVIFVALPIAFTMNTFGEFYENQRQREKLLRRRKTLWYLRRETLTREHSEHSQHSGHSSREHP